MFFLQLRYTALSFEIINTKKSKEALLVLTYIPLGKYISGMDHRFTFMDTPCKTFYGKNHIHFALIKILL